jgi:hypothetical protein
MDYVFGVEISDMKKHMGFKAAAKSVAKREGIPMKNASAIIAAGTRNASAGAKHRNHYLSKVKGGYR